MANAQTTHLSLRLQLLKDGYVPLKNKRKQCFEKGWSTFTVDEALIESWEPHPRSKVKELTTGVRCDGLAAIDIDMDDPDLRLEVYELVEDIAPNDILDAPVRVGNPEHNFLVFRADEHLRHKIQTGRYVVPDKDSPQAVEILAGSGCQFGAFGQYNDTTEYAWPMQSLLGTASSHLPLLTAKQANELIEKTRELFESAGLEQVNPVANANGSYEVTRDLTPEMEVTLEDGDVVTVEALQELSYSGRCCMSFVRPGADSPTSGSISLGADGMIMITDFVTGLVHALPVVRTATEVSPALAAIQRPRGPSAGSAAPYGLQNRPTFSRDVLPDLLRTANGAVRQVQVVTLGNIAAAMEAMNILPVTNLMSGEVEFEGDFEENITAIDVRTMIAGACKLRGLASREDIDDHINVLARHNSFHPMADWINSRPWDGKPRFHEMISTTIEVMRHGERAARGIYARRWAIQVIEAVMGRQPTQKAGVWILIGDQGIGKTQWLSRFAGGPEFFNEGCELHLEGFASSRDGLIAATTKPITELGEVETTFGRSNQNSLKNLISRSVDSYRPAYGRHVERRPRMTSFCATANTVAFLMDVSGSRRYWPIHVKRCDFEGLSRYDMQQVWAEVATWWAGGEQWWLTDVEAEMQMAREEDFEQDNETRESVKLYLERARKGRWRTVAKGVLEIATLLQLGKKPADLALLRAQLNAQVGHMYQRHEGRTRVWAWPMKRMSKGSNAP